MRVESKQQDSHTRPLPASEVDAILEELRAAIDRGGDTPAAPQSLQGARLIGKEPIMVNRDVAGFVINRINFPSAIEAMNLVEQGVATVEDIDKGLRLAAGRRMGIFETGDMVGTIIYLASDASRFVTGQTIMVDGGTVML